MRSSTVGTIFSTTTSIAAQVPSFFASEPPSTSDASLGSVPQRPRGLHAMPSGQVPWIRGVVEQSAWHFPARQ
jgi:hypothetical protein